MFLRLIPVLVSATCLGASATAQAPQLRTATHQHTLGSDPGEERPAARAWITNAAALSEIAAPRDLIGRRISIRDVRVDAVGSREFWIAVDEAGVRLRVIPAEGRLIAPTPGTIVSVQGEFRYAPGDASLDHPYIYAYTVRPAW